MIHLDGVQSARSRVFHQAVYMPVFLLSDEIIFPSPYLASKEGLLAVGGDLSRERLLLAYRMGIFPWYSEGEPVLWWSPDPRLVLYPEAMHVSKTLKKVLRQDRFELTVDTVFDRVIRACAALRLQDGQGTWIVDEMIEAYNRLHADGYAHSVEAWQDDQLVGGLYGVSLGHAFFGESMFSRVSNASNAALITLVSHLRSSSFSLIDCQVTTAHLQRFGAQEIPRDRFLDELKTALQTPTLKGKWAFSKAPAGIVLKS